MKEVQITAYESFDGKRFTSKVACMKYEQAFSIRSASTKNYKILKMLQLMLQIRHEKGPAFEMYKNWYNQLNCTVCRECLSSSNNLLGCLARKLDSQKYACSSKISSFLYLYQRGYLQIDLGDECKVDITDGELNNIIKQINEEHGTEVRLVRHGEFLL